MIELTRLNGHPFVVNCDLIKFAEATPDTTLTMVTGEKLIVRESCDVLSERILQYRGSVLRCAWPEPTASLIAQSAYAASCLPSGNPPHPVSD